MLRHPNPVISLAVLCTWLAACGSDVRVNETANTQTSTATAESTADASGYFGIVAPAAGSLVVRIGFAVDAGGPIDLNGRACLPATGVLSNTLTAADFYHLAGNAQTGFGQVFDVAASIRVADGFLVGTFAGADAATSGYLDGYVDADPLLRRWRSQTGCQGTWTVNRARSAATSAVSDVFQASAWVLEAYPTGAHADDGGACGRWHGEMTIVEGALSGQLADPWGQTISTAGHLTPVGDAAALLIEAGRNGNLTGRFDARTAAGSMATANGCDYAWRGTRILAAE
ncbi:MAG: hypothetical protein ACFCUG_09985 [Thiotrichales bacterium]